MQVKDIMRTQFVSFQADDKLEHIIKTFATEHITSAPVFDNGEYIGMVSEVGLVSYFTPKKYLLLWKKDKQTPIDEIKKVTAKMLAKKSTLSLNPTQEISAVLSEIVKRPYTLAVLQNGKLVGIIRGDDIVNFFLKELAIGEYSKNTINESESEASNMSTEIDKLLEILKVRKEVPCSVLSKELGLSIKTVEKMCENLEKHHLVKVKYSFFKGPVVKEVEDGKK